MVATLELDEDVLGLVAELSGDPLPGDGPSSEVVTVDGLERGRGAVVQSQTVDTAVSLVVGMRRRPSLAGVPVEATYPFGPRLGAALNVTALPMGDQLHLGVNIDPAAVTHPAVLMASMRRAFAALVGARTRRELVGVAVVPHEMGDPAS